jgi:hypothetical protein
MRTCLADGSCLAVADGAEIVRRPAGTERWYHESVPGLGTPVETLACDADLCRVDSAAWGSTPAAGTLGDGHWISHDGGLIWIQRPEELTTLACPIDAVCLGVGTWVSAYGLAGGPSAGITVDNAAFVSIDLTGVQPPLEGWSCDFTMPSSSCSRPALFTSFDCPAADRCVAGYWSGAPVEFTTSDGWSTVDVARAD